MALNEDVTVEANGKTYTLKLGINQMIALEEKYSTPEQRVTFQELLLRVGADKNRPNLLLTRDIIHVSLSKHHPDMSVEDAGELIDAAGTEIGTVFPKLLGMAKPDEKDVQALGVRQRRPPIRKTA